VERARALVRRLRSELPEASWTKPESWHVTIHFLGEISEAESRRFATLIRRPAEAVLEGDLVAAGAVVFPPRGAARVLGADFEPTAFTESLGQLAAAAVRLSADIHNPKPATQNHFHPHVTFARIRRPWSPAAAERYCQAVGEWRAPAWRARSCVLYRSRLDPGGAVHTPMETWSFSPAPAGVTA